MNGGALQDALESGSRLRVAVPARDQVGQLVVEVLGHLLAQPLQLDAAGPHDRDGILVLGERQEQMLERGVLVAASRSVRQRPMKRLFQVSRQHDLYSFSSVSCSGCSWRRAKSTTCATLVSATSYV